MPGISDPGYELIAAASQRGFPIVPIPGPSTVITALAVSGLPTDKFVYIGFLPRKASERKRLLESIASESGTIVVLEAPHRLTATLEYILSVLGDREIAVCRELTKVHEEIFRGTISQAIKHFVEPRGEFTLVIEGEREEKKPLMTVEIERKLRSMRRSGKTAKEAIARVAEESGLPRKELYRAWLRAS
jgi:16S rRNA (cytidine1402-2'-O)-methyltransferase